MTQGSRAIRELLPHVCSQTGFLHVRDGMSSVEAPAKENFLYALLLFRCKTHESIHEGRELLKRLLFFQNCDPTSDQYGNFPAILTDYPACRDWRLPVFLCTVMTALRTSFDTVLGEEVRTRLHAAHALLFSCAQRNAEKCTYRSFERFIMALQEWFLEKTHDNPIEAASNRFLEERGWMRPDGLGLALAALSHFPPSPTRISDYAQQLWHPQAATYAGPALDVRQWGSSPAPTLLDMSLRGDPRQWTCQAALEKALITPRTWPLPAGPMPFDPSYPMWTLGSVAVSACLSRQPPSCHPVRIVTPTCTIAIIPNGIVSSLSLDGTRLLGRIQAENTPEDPCLLQAYVERTESVCLLVGDKKASVFSSEEGISMNGIHLFLATPNVRCVGHVGLGNRPNQKKGGEPFDWKISLDIVRGNIEDEVKFIIDIGG